MSRRRALTAALGAAVAVAHRTAEAGATPAVTGQQPPSPLATGEAEPETSALSDQELLAFAASVATTVAELLDEGLRPAVEASLQATVALFAQQNREHAAALAVAAGQQEAAAHQVIVDEYRGRIEATRIPGDAGVIAAELTHRTAATYAHLLGRFETIDAAAAVAGIVPVVSAQSGILGSTLGRQLKEIFPAGGALTGEVAGLGSPTLGFSPERYRSLVEPEVQP